MKPDAEQLQEMLALRKQLDPDAPDMIVLPAEPVATKSGDEQPIDHVIHDSGVLRLYLCSGKKFEDNREPKCRNCGAPLMLTGFDAWWEGRKGHP